MVTEKMLEERTGIDALPSSIVFRATACLTMPSPNTQQVMVQLDHFQCGLNFPLSKFMLEVLVFYKIKLIHVATNLVLFLAIFVHLCEAYLGVLPSLVLL